MSDYRLSPALTARLVGSSLAVLAVLVFAATAAVAILAGPFWVVLLVAGGGVVGAVTAYAVARRIAVLHLDDVGYRVRIVRGAGVRAAAWPDVREVAEARTDDGRFLVLRLTDDRATTVPLQALAAPPGEVLGAVRRAVRAAAR